MKAVFQEFVAVFGEGGVALLFVQLVVRLGQFGDVGVQRLVEIAAVLRRAGNDQRRARLIHQDAVDLVDDGEVMPALHHLGDRGFHVVAQIVEAQFVVRRIGDVGLIGRAFLCFRLERIDDADRHPQRMEHLAHPSRVALGQIVVHCDDVHAAPRQRIQIGGKGCDKRLALAGLHLADVALMQEYPTHQLHVEGTQAKRAPRGLAAVRERLGQHRIEALAARDARLQRDRFFLDPVVAQRLELRLQRIDLVDQRPRRLDLAVIRRAEHLFRKRSEA